MRRLLPLVLSLAAIMLTASTCDKERFKLYHDSDGRTTSLIGAWGLVEVQYFTAGVVEKTTVTPESLMEFMEGGLGRTLKMMPDGSRETIDTFHYEKYPGSITIFTEEEYKINRSYTPEDNEYRRGKTYAFKVIDDNTISSKEKVSEGSYIVNVFARY